MARSIAERLASRQRKAARKARRDARAAAAAAAPQDENRPIPLVIRIPPKKRVRKTGRGSGGCPGRLFPVKTHCRDRT